MILFSGNVFHLHRSTSNVVLKFHHKFHFLSRCRILNIFSLHLQNVAGSNPEAFHMPSFLLPTEADKKTAYGHQATFEEFQKT